MSHPGSSHRRPTTGPRTTRRAALGFAALNVLCGGSLAVGAQTENDGVTWIEVTEEVKVADVKPFGLNLGGRDQFEAAQSLRSLVGNPGFEAGRFGMVIHATKESKGNRWVQDFWDTRWNSDPYGIGQPPGFWDGAEWEIAYGPGKWRRGLVTSYRHENHQPVFYLDDVPPDPNQWDVLFVRKEVDGLSHAGPFAFASSDHRAGSPGVQSMRLVHSPGSSWDWWMDSSWRDGDRSSGKLFLVEGDWRLEFWARGSYDGARVRVVFQREDEADFLDAEIALTSKWRKYRFDFTVPEGMDQPGPYTESDYHPILGARLYVPKDGDHVWVDDFLLEQKKSREKTAFFDELVETYREFRPGILRHWANQNGDSLDNQLASPFARQTYESNHNGRDPKQQQFSLHEFLELCAAVGAEPWYVVPVVFPPEDLQGLMEYLGGPADGAHPYADLRAELGRILPWTKAFTKIHLEYGNEAWGSGSGGDPFRGATLMGGQRLGAIAHDRLGILRASPWFEAGRLDLVIGGQASNPGTQTEIESRSSNHDSIALAPYYGQWLEDWTNDEDLFGSLYARAFEDVRPGGTVRQSVENLRGFGKGTKLSVYELNFHPTDRNDGAPSNVRNDLVTSEGGGIALPLYQLQYLEAFGARDQCAFTTFGYSHQVEGIEPVRVWGLLRDLHGTGRRRPGWLAGALVNRALIGNLVETRVYGATPHWEQPPANDLDTAIRVPYVKPFAFRKGKHGSLVLFNLHRTDSLPVRLQFPVPVHPIAELSMLAASNLHADNEESEAVSVMSSLTGLENGTELLLPPHSITVLEYLRF